jgi:hypothetical protein
MVLLIRQQSTTGQNQEQTARKGQTENQRGAAGKKLDA